jgi:Ca2+-binding RTX toxin-like protein
MAIIRGTNGNDTLRGTLDADTIFGFGGSDTISGRAGDDTVRGGAGGDDIRGELGNDRLHGDGGFDDLTGGRGNDRVFGGAGGDRLRDAADGADGNDLYDGGSGTDTVYYDDQFVGLNLTLADGAADVRAVQGGEVDVLRSIENVVGSLGDDLIVGNGADNLLDGGSRGNDRLYGRGGDDVLGGANATTLLLDGESGDDTLSGGFGRARLFGGTGADTLFASFERAGQAADVDRNDLGRDAAADTFSATASLFQGSFSAGFGVERVRNVGEQDRFDLTLREGSDVLVRAGDFLDSDGNGVVNDADRDARLVGGNLVLDLDRLFEREHGQPIDLGEQHVILERIASIGADQFL